MTTDPPSRTRVDAFLEMLDQTEDKVSLDFMPGLYGAGLRAVAPWTEGLCHDISKWVRAVNRAAGIVTKYVFVGATPSVSFATRAMAIFIRRIVEDIRSRLEFYPAAEVVVTTFPGRSDAMAIECEDPIRVHASTEEAVVVQLLANAEQRCIVQAVGEQSCSCYAIWTSPVGMKADDRARLLRTHQLIWKSPEYGPERMAWHVYSLRMDREFGRDGIDPLELPPYSAPDAAGVNDQTF
jgi:hypothetical protein